MNESRIKYSYLNFLASMANFLLLLIIKLFIRSTISKVLGSQYLGVESLFSNILSVLGLAELGFGSAIIYRLYKPIQENNVERIQALVLFYKSVYRIVSLVILVVGICLIPFLTFFIKDDMSFMNYRLVFFMYLLQSVSSYAFFAYRSALLTANQKEYIKTTISTVVTIVCNILQIAYLHIFEDFVGYVFILVIANIVTNLITSIYVNNKYSECVKKPTRKLPKEEIHEMLHDCYAIFIYKINGVVIKVTDNFVLSKMIGLTVVGKYSNYVVFLTAYENVLMKLCNSLTASIGNLHTIGDDRKDENIFNTLNFCICFVAGAFVSGFVIDAQCAISLIYGKDYVLSRSIVYGIAAEAYMYGIMKISDIFRSSHGLFQYAKYRPILASVINLIISILMCYKLGVLGVILGTVISNAATYIWLDPYILYKHSFHMDVRNYYLKQIKYLVLLIVSVIITSLLTSGISNISWWSFIIKGFIAVAVFALIYLGFNWKSNECTYMKNIAKSFTSRLFRK